MNFLNIVLSVRLWPQSQIKMCTYIIEVHFKTKETYKVTQVRLIVQHFL